MRASAIFYALVALFALAVPLLGIYPVFMMQLLCFGMLACAFDLLLGFSGMLSFGHAAFFGAAAYFTGWLTTVQKWGTVEAIVAGVALGAAMGLVFGYLAIRRHGIYFAMITLGLAQLVYFVCLEAPFTGGENGLQGVPRGSLLGIVPLHSDLVMYYFVLAVSVAVFLFLRRVVGSPFGQVLRAIRDNEPRATSLGYTITRYKLVAFIISAAVSGLAGALKAVVLGFVTLSDVEQSTSGLVVLMALLGGTGTYFGPVIGAAVVITLQQYLSDAVGGWVTVIIGAIFVACVMAFRKGIVGELAARLSRRTS